MNVSMILLKKEFAHADSKTAYLKACGWMAKNIVSKVEASSDILFSIEKKKDASLPTFILEVHTTIDAKEHQESFCGACREFSSSFFMNKSVDCNSCKYNAFTKQIDQRLVIKKEYKKERMELS